MASTPFLSGVGTMCWQNIRGNLETAKETSSLENAALVCS